MNEKVSIIIPAYNAEKTIKICLESVISQSYGNIEIIVIDDGSKDKTFDVIEEYTKIDSRVKAFRKENGGQSSARNVGLDHMHGNYFTFVDSDDTIQKDMIEKLVERLQETSAEVSMCGMVYKTAKSTSELYCEECVHIKGRDEIIRSFLTERFVFGPVCKLYSTEKFGHIRFTPGIIFEDIEYLSRVYMECESVASCVYPGYIYYVWENSTVHSKFSARKLDLIKVTDTIKHLVKQKGISCERELQLFILNSYLSVLLMIADSGCYKEQREIIYPLVSWIRMHSKEIQNNSMIPKRKKIYAKIFANNRLFLIHVLVYLRRVLH